MDPLHFPGATSTDPNPNPPQDAPARRSQDNQSPQREYDDHHVYGGKGAVVFSASMTRGSEKKAAQPTVFIEGAKALGPRKYDWKRGQKISIQLTMQELPAVAAVFLGIRPSAEYRHHGEKKDKWFSVEKQGENFFMKIGQEKRVVAVPITPSDAYYVTQIFLKQLAAPRGLSATDVMNILARTMKPA